MPYASSDGVKLYFEETGTGTPIIFVHEFAADWRSWEAQVRHFGRHYRCIAYSARGYTGSDVPTDQSLYSYEHFADDIGVVLDHLGIDRAYVVGLSMGAYAALQFGLRAPDRVLGLVLAGVGSGSPQRKCDLAKPVSTSISFGAESSALATNAFEVCASRRFSAAMPRITQGCGLSGIERVSGTTNWQASGSWSALIS